METLIVYPENKEQLDALKAVMKVMKITFEEQKVNYPSYIIDDVKLSMNQAGEGLLTPYKGVKDMLDLK